MTEVLCECDWFFLLSAPVLFIDRAAAESADVVREGEIGMQTAGGFSESSCVPAGRRSVKWHEPPREI